MAPKAGKILARVRSATFEIEGDEWVMEFRPFSSDMMRQADKGSAEEQLDYLSNLLSKSIIAWNLEDDDGNPMPIAPDKHIPPAAEGEEGEVIISPGTAWLRAAGIDYVRLIFDAMVEAMKVPKASESASNGGLRRVV